MTHITSPMHGLYPVFYLRLQVAAQRRWAEAAVPNMSPADSLAPCTAPLQPVHLRVAAPLSPHRGHHQRCHLDSTKQ